MPRGGARTGAGRKPKEDRPRRPQRPPNVVAIDGGRAGEETVSGIPPKDLPEDQQEFWRRNAPRAIAAGTLTPQSIEAFLLLCELDAEKRATKSTLDKDGRTYLDVTVDGSGQEHSSLKAHPLTTSYRQLAQRVEGLLARFGLAPFGKPIAGSRAKSSTVSPWAAIAAGAKNGRP